MAWWEQSESIHFDYVLYDMFDWFGDYDNALRDWSDDEWRSEFEKQLAMKDYSDEIKQFVLQEFDRFLVWKKEENANTEDSHVWSSDEINKHIEELNQRDIRKLKQLPDVIKLIEKYNKVKQELGKDGSDNNYSKVFDVCYTIVTKWQMLKLIPEFKDVYDYYENCALEYLHKKHTIESLYHVVICYTDSDILWQMTDKEAKRERIITGLPYVEFLHEHLNSEDSAERYVDCYLMLNIFYEREGLEELKYASKAYKLAKQFVNEFKSEKMLDMFKKAVMCMTVYYREHDQEYEAVKLEKEYEEIAAQL